MAKRKPTTVTQKQLESNAKQWAVACECNDEKRYIEFKMQKMFEKANWSEPSRAAKQVSGWTKNNMLLESWNMYIAVEEARGEQIFGEKAFQHLGEMTRIELLEEYSKFLQVYINKIKEE